MQLHAKLILQLAMTLEVQRGVPLQHCHPFQLCTPHLQIRDFVSRLTYPTAQPQLCETFPGSSKLSCFAYLTCPVQPFRRKSLLGHFRIKPAFLELLRPQDAVSKGWFLSTNAPILYHPSRSCFSSFSRDMDISSARHQPHLQ